MSAVESAKACMSSAGYQLRKTVFPENFGFYSSYLLSYFIKITNSEVSEQTSFLEFVTKPNNFSTQNSVRDGSKSENQANSMTIKWMSL